MEITLVVDGKSRKKIAEKGATVGHFLERSGLNPETVILKRNGKLVHPDTPVSEGDTVELIGIIYGG